jgi:hypothetical protein
VRSDGRSPANAGRDRQQPGAHGGCGQVVEALRRSLCVSAMGSHCNTKKYCGLKKHTHTQSTFLLLIIPPRPSRSMRERR